MPNNTAQHRQALRRLAWACLVWLVLVPALLMAETRQTPGDVAPPDTGQTTASSASEPAPILALSPHLLVAEAVLFSLILLGLYLWNRNLRREIVRRQAIERDLRIIQENLNAAQRIAQLGSWTLDLTRNQLSWSDEIYRIFEVDPERFSPSYETFLDTIHPDDRAAVDRAYRESLQNRQAYSITHRLRFPDGRIKWVHEQCETRFDDSNGKPLISFGTVHDISEQHQANQRLKLAAQVFSHAREGIIITDAGGNIIEVNEAFSRISGYHHDEVVGRNPRLLRSGRHGPAFYRELWTELKQQGHWQGEVWDRHKDGGIYAVLVTISAVRESDGVIKNFVALYTDITAQKQHEKRLEYLAHFDALTGLPNRILLADRLGQAMHQSKRRDLWLAVLYLDLDGFKEINDSHGHQTGDQLLVAIAERFKNSLRHGDTIARLGGDEFVAALVDLRDKEESAPLIERMISAAAEPTLVEGLELRVSASIGVTFYPQSSEVDADQLLRQADQAMYQAKLAGKNRYHLFDPQRDAGLQCQHESIERIRQALENNEFCLYYQPKVNMRTGTVFGAEALIRWQHPERGLLSPGEFLPIIEEHPLIVDLGNWVLQTAIRQLAAWRALGVNLQVSVNTAPRELHDPLFVQRLRGLLETCEQDLSGWLELEVLETSALTNITQVSQVIRKCMNLGVSFSLDDFGTGYSSLTYLKRLPVSSLKVDQSFVRDILDDPDDLAILEAVMGLANAFRRDLVAEGVETLEHGIILIQLGCTYGQGYGIARPMPAEQFIDWLGNWTHEDCWKDQQPLHKDDFAILYAGVEHRAWIKQIIEFLHDEALEPPNLDPWQCRFGQWLQQRIADGDDSRLHAVAEAHCSAHDWVRELVTRKNQGQLAEPRTELVQQLKQRQREVLAQLQYLFAT